MKDAAKNSTTKHVAVAVGALGALGAIAAVALLLLSGPSGHDGLDYSCGGVRNVTVDLSSQNRSDTAVEVITEVITAHTLGAGICKEPLTVLGVAGGTQVLIDPDVPFLDELRGPNDRARANAVSDRADDVRNAVADELEAVYATYDAVDVTSVPALFQAAADHIGTTGESRVVILTTGVHDDTALTLNRPLDPGEGQTLANGLRWPDLGPDVTVAIIGITKMDGDLPVPGDLWPREVIAFNRVACTATGATTCDLYQVAGLDKVLA